MTVNVSQHNASTFEDSAWSLERLSTLSMEEIMLLFYSLDAPALETMNGEYKATVLSHVSLSYRLMSALTVKNPLLDGLWLNKSFEPIDHEFGHGYNTFEKFGRTIRKHPMQTSIRKSRYDGKPIYQLDYTAFHSPLGKINMVDEVRQLDSTHFLGIGTAGFTHKQRQKPMPFLLVGPYNEFVGTDKEYRKTPARFT